MRRAVAAGAGAGKVQVLGAALRRLPFQGLNWANVVRWIVGLGGIVDVGRRPLRCLEHGGFGNSISLTMRLLSPEYPTVTEDGRRGELG